MIQGSKLTPLHQNYQLSVWPYLRNQAQQMTQILHVSTSDVYLESASFLSDLQLLRYILYDKTMPTQIDVDYRIDEQSSFSNLSVTSPTLQPFCCFTYVTVHSPTLLSLLLRHRLFTNVTWRAANANKEYKSVND